MRKNYLAGNYGYGHAKKELLGLILDRYAEERETFAELIQDTTTLDNQLTIGEEKARSVANEVLGKVKKCLGYN